MKIDLLCSDPQHPIVPQLRLWMTKQRGHEVALLHSRQELEGGDILYLISCHELIDAQARAAYAHTLVLHASDLPQGRGWSPHVWMLLEGARQITVSLLEAEDQVDTGAIWGKRSAQIPEHLLFDEINRILFRLELELMDLGVELVMAGDVKPAPQEEARVRYFRRRTPADSRLDPAKSLEECFDQLRLADPDRYPAFFSLHGHDFELRISKRKSGTENE